MFAGSRLFPELIITAILLVVFIIPALQIATQILLIVIPQIIHIIAINLEIAVNQCFLNNVMGTIWIPPRHMYQNVIMSIVARNAHKIFTICRLGF
jgi:hypothetical protein